MKQQYIFFGSFFISMFMAISTAQPMRDRSFDQRVLRSFLFGTNPFAEDYIPCIHADADQTETDSNGRTALHKAIIIRCNCIEILITKYDANVNAQDNDGYTSLHYAAEKGTENFIDLLLNLDAQIDKQDKSGWTPLHCAASNGNLESIRLLVDRGSCVLKQTKNGDTAETLAARCGHKEVAAFLKSKKPESGILTKSAKPAKKESSHHDQ